MTVAGFQSVQSVFIRVKYLAWGAKQFMAGRPTAPVLARYRCFLPDLAGLAGLRRVGPGTRLSLPSQQVRLQSLTGLTPKPRRPNHPHRSPRPLPRSSRSPTAPLTTSSPHAHASRPGHRRHRRHAIAGPTGGLGISVHGPSAGWPFALASAHSPPSSGITSASSPK